mmetsp:Transcript_29160/g.41036  ORF Transcript_29160/g.41036 Transcript_29160/m.41036 type:complete len:514 (+) Transcript_29160:1220-2761(+)
MQNSPAKAPSETKNLPFLPSYPPNAHYKVGYKCDCSRLFDISEELYYCQGCQKMRCSFCVTQEIDSFYCPNCLDNMASSEATTYKNSCKKCFECPCCHSALSYHASTAADPSLDISSLNLQPGAPYYYLKCEFCQWDSLAAKYISDTPNGLTALSLEKEKDDKLQVMFNKMRDSLQKDEKDKAKARKSLLRKKSTMFRLTTPINSSASDRVKLKAPALNLNDLDKAVEAKKKKHPSELPAPIDPNLDSIEELKLLEDYSNITTTCALEQRVSQTPQPDLLRELIPKRKHLLTRRSKHCYKCDKLLVKPDLNAAKIEFKRQHVAIFFLPNITVYRVDKLALNEVCPVFIKFSNPVHTLMNVTISPYVTYVDNNLDSINQSAQIGMLLVDTFLPPKDHDDEDDDDTIKGLKAKDDPSCVIFRKSNWMLVKVPVTPTKFHDIQFNLLVSIKYKASSGDQDLKFPVNIFLGDISWGGPKVDIKIATPPTVTRSPSSVELKATAPAEEHPLQHNPDDQ